MKRCQKLGRALPPPLFGQNPKEQQLFSGRLPLVYTILDLSFYLQLEEVGALVGLWQDFEVHPLCEFSSVY